MKIRSNITNLLLEIDSYKHSHPGFFPKDMKAGMAYISSRGGVFDETLFFGLQMILKKYFSKPITHEDIDEAKEVLTQMNLDFEEEQWRRLVDKHKGLLPLRIRAVKEGTWVPTNNALSTIEVTDHEFAWLYSTFENILLRVWYPTTVATLSGKIKKLLIENARETSDSPEELLKYKLCDFGSRAASSGETSGIGGGSHLLSFYGTDNLPAISFINQYYNNTGELNVFNASSIPATEHSTITSWGRSFENKAYENLVVNYLGPNKMVACVADSYNIENAIKNIFGKELKEKIIQSKGILVIRPDSGVPLVQVMNSLNWLSKAFGFTVNSLGYKVLKHVRVIQGDGINYDSIKEILTTMKQHKWSIDNIAFGMGGALIQQVNRDTQKFAMKTCAVLINDQWHSVFKDPIDDHGKTSFKIGRLTLAKNKEGVFKTIKIEDVGKDGFEDQMSDVFLNGVVLCDFNFDEISLRLA